VVIKKLTEAEAKEEQKKAGDRGYKKIELRQKGDLYDLHFHPGGDFHRRELEWLAKRLRETLEHVYVSTTENKLPRSPKGKVTHTGSVYQPDIIICGDKETKMNIERIVEIETTPDIAGKMILANYCIRKHIENGIQNEKPKPRLLFVAIASCPDLFQKRISAVKSDCECIEVDVCRMKEVMGKIYG